MLQSKIGGWVFFPHQKARGNVVLRRTETVGADPPDIPNQGNELLLSCGAVLCGVFCVAGSVR